MSERGPRVFGVGMSRTGTISLTFALERLGYRTIHYPAPDAMLAGDFGVLDAYDAATDLSVAAFFPQLDARYPGSRFIHTTRPVEGWLASIRRRYENHDTGPPDNANGDLRQHVYGIRHYDEAIYRRAFFQHEARVRAYFADRPDDLVTLRIVDGDGWEPLCAFLGKDVPPVGFPNRNAGQDRLVDRLHLGQFWITPPNAG